MHRIPICLFSVLALVMMGFPALAQGGSRLQESQVLVVYDARIADSLAIAEFYAGSANVPGGSGAEPGVRPGVHVFNLASAGIPALPTNGNIGYTRFRDDIRDPLRAHLNATGLVFDIRCVVLTKGIPHRVQDSDDVNVGDRPSNFVTEWEAGDATCASVDSELTLLWQDLELGEAGGRADSFSDGWVVNPYWQASAPISSFDNTNLTVQKALFTISPNRGRLWREGFGDPSVVLSAGDLLLVSRLDGHTVADVRASVLRGQGVVYDVESAAIVFDESGSDGVANGIPNTELDNQGDPLSNAGDDFETARDLLLADGRFDASRINYNSANGPANFIVGPLIDFGGEGLLLTEPVLLIAHYGQNHAGSKPNDGPLGSAAPIYAESFTYVDGAIFNTVESYNARALATQGTLFNQEQAADFLAAGGTFAAGHAWEPLALTLPDNEFIVGNFILGDLTWAEAAWSSIPALSWMHVVLGDPLATACTSVEDRTRDGMLDIFDVLGYLDDFAAEEPSADLDDSGMFDIFDVLAYLAFFERGC